MSVPPSPNDLTRQQLDELDSLLQRMLSLPLSGPAEDAPPPAPPAELPTPPGWRADGGGAAVKLPHLLADPAAVAAPVAVPEPRAASAAPPWGPDPLARYAPPAAGERPFGPPTPETGVPPSAGSAYQYSLPVPTPAGPLRGVDAPALPAGFRSLLAEAEAEADRPHPPTPPPRPVPAPFPVTVDPNPPLPVFLWPVVAANWVLEGLLGLLGPVGAALTRPAAKHLLGFAGVVLLAGAGLWAARGLGWVHFDLPWPR
jgi:hypothetical protein